MPVRYEEYLPAPVLAPFVEVFWQLALDPEDPADLVHTIVPDGAVSLAGSLWNGQLLGAALMGPGETAQQVPLHQGMTVIGARLCPGAAERLLGIRPAALKGAVTMLPPKHWAQDAFSGGLGGLGAALAERARHGPPPDRLITRAAAALDRGEAVAAVAAGLGLSPRQLQRRFAAASGLTPKSWQRLRRQRLAWINLVSGDAASLTETAHSAGFADSAHFSREVRRCFRWAPGDVAAYLGSIAHGALHRPAEPGN